MLRRTLFLVPLLALLLAGCAPQLPALSPESAVRRELQQQPDEFRMQQVAIYSSRALGAGVLVLYGAVRELDIGVQTDPVQVFGYSVAERAAVGWRSAQGASFGGTGRVGAVTYQSASLDAQRSMVYGHVFLPEAAFVEVTMDTGEVVREAPQNGAFALIGARAGALKELRLLSASGAVLYHSTLPQS